jgi:hypothetical protein
MTIGKKLYVNFGAILAMVLVLFLIKPRRHWRWPTPPIKSNFRSCKTAFI